MKQSLKKIVALVKLDRSSGMTFREIGDKYDISLKTAHRYDKIPLDDTFVEAASEKYERLLPLFLESQMSMTNFCRQHKIGAGHFSRYLITQGVVYEKKVFKPWSNDEIALVLSDYRAGLSILEIAKKSKRSAEAVKKVCTKHRDIISNGAKVEKKRIRPLPPPKPLSKDGLGPKPKEWRFQAHLHEKTVSKNKYDLRQYSGVTPIMWERQQVQVVANVLAWPLENAREAIRHTRKALGYRGGV